MIELTGPTSVSLHDILIAGDLAEEEGRDDLAGALRWLAAHPIPRATPAAEILVLAAVGGLRLRVVPGVGAGAGMIVEAPGLDRVEWPAGSMTRVAFTFGEIVASAPFVASGYVLMDRGGRDILRGSFDDGFSHDVATGSTFHVVVNIRWEDSTHPIASLE